MLNQGSGDIIVANFVPANTIMLPCGSLGDERIGRVERKKRGRQGYILGFRFGRTFRPSITRFARSLHICNANNVLAK